MKKILFLLVIGFLASTVHAKESAVNTTIDFDRLIDQELKSTTVNYDVIARYIDNSQKGISVQQIDDLYLRIFRGVCATGERKETEFTEIKKILPWQYTYSTRFLRDVASIAAFRDSQPNVGICVLSMVSHYKMAGPEFLDVMLDVAKEYNAKNLENTVSQVKQEIEKQEIDKLNKNG